MYGLAAAPALRRESRSAGRLRAAAHSALSLPRRASGVVAAWNEDGSLLRRARATAALVAAVATVAATALPVGALRRDPALAGAEALGATGRRLASGLPGGDLRQAARIVGSVPIAGGLVYMGADGEPVTAGRLAGYLRRQGSPMAPYAADLVEAGLRYRIDPRVIVAIAGVESTFGIYDYGHNAWGWGSIRWRTWPAAIDGFTRALSERYRSLRTGRFAAASRTYCPPCGPRWAAKALRIFAEI